MYNGCFRRAPWKMGLRREMKRLEDICFLIEAKSNSERLPGKIFKKFSQTTLLDVAINKFLSSPAIPNNQIYVAGHGEEVLDLASKYTNINLFKRTDNSVSDSATIRQIYEIFDHIRHPFFVEINACCPLLSVNTIDKFVEEYLQSDHNGMFGVVKRRTFYWDSNKAPLKECTPHLDTKKANVILEAAHCLYAGSTDDIKNNIHMGSFLHKGDPDLFIIENEGECWDIDYDWQFKIAEKMFENII